MSDDPLSWHGRTVIDQEGHKIGKVDEIYVDDVTGRPGWALVNTGFFGTSSSFVPLAQATASGDDVVVPYTKEQVKDAPRMDGDRELTGQDEGALHRHYGLQQQASPTGPPGPGGDQPVAGPAMTRSEEEMRVGTETRESGRARIRKHVVTERVTESIPISREEARIVREPITDAAVGDATHGPELSEDEHEVILTEEVPVVETRTVPRERVRLDTTTVTEERVVEEDLRREVIDVDGPTDTRR